MYKATFKQFEVKASYKGTKKTDWSSDNFNNHMVTVTNTETEQKITFEFWASIANPELNKEYDILNAFYCFVSDAVSGSESFNEFCSNLGYDEDSRTAEKIYKKCKKQLEKLNKIYDGDIYDLVNKLSEQYA
jgi:cellulose biosynthesis protein BcsQ